MAARRGAVRRADTMQSGIDAVGEIASGTRLCQLYQSTQDLLDVVVPYFRAGLEANEYCLWVLPDVISEFRASQAMREAIPGFLDYAARGHIEVLRDAASGPHGGDDDAPEIAERVGARCEQALTQAYAGLRVAGGIGACGASRPLCESPCPLVCQGPAVEERALVLCCLPLDRCSAAGLVDIINNQDLVIVRRGDRWVCIDTVAQKETGPGIGELHEDSGNGQRGSEGETSKVGAAVMREKKERQDAQRQLQFSDAAFRSIQESIIAFDTDHRIVHWNEVSERMYGLEASEVLGRNLFDVIEMVDTYPGQVAALMQELETTGHSRQEVLHRTKRAEVWVSVGVHEMLDEGRRTGFIALATDITDRKFSEEALLDSEERFSSLVNNLRLGIFRSTPGKGGKFLEVNPAMEGITGYPREDLLRMDVADLYWNPEERTAVLEKAAAAGGVIQELYLRKKDGTRILVSDTKFVIADATGQIAYLDGVMEDITDRKAAEKERRELEQRAQTASRLASIGEMASGIAHEINNPLASITGFADLLLERDIPPDIREDIRVINSEAERAAGIVRKLLTFARGGGPEREYVSIHEILRTSLDLRFYELETNNIGIHTAFNAQNDWTMADGSQLQQVFLNLIVNAELALKQRGRRRMLSVVTENAKRTIRISFSDNGPGIRPEHLDRVFDPFFTTRKKGEGTGLGLSVCHGIVSEHRGRIHAERSPEGGATFVIELPILPEKKAATAGTAATAATDEAEPAVNARLLVVDDEPAVLRFLCRALRRRGYEVDGVGDAKEVLRQLHAEDYDLILMDIKLPGCSGVDLYRHIQRRRPTLAKRVLFITGDVMATDTRRFLSRTRVHYIAKPFSADHLREEVGNALAELDQRQTGPRRRAGSTPRPRAGNEP